MLSAGDTGGGFILTVAELIAELEKQNPDSELRIIALPGGCRVESVGAGTGAYPPDIVYIETDYPRPRRWWERLTECDRLA